MTTYIILYIKMYSISIGHGMIYLSTETNMNPYVFLQEYSKHRDKEKAMKLSKYAYYERKGCQYKKK
jgi:hypothetical protein